MNEVALPLNSDTLAAALAVVGEADRGLFAHLLDCAAGDALLRSLLVQLAARPEITYQAERWIMQPESATAMVEALETTDLLHFRELHRRAVEALAARVCDGETAAEAQLMAVFTRLADHLRIGDASQLPALSAMIAKVPLQGRGHQHFRSYVAGISLQQTGQYAALIDLCNTLLAQPDLSMTLRGRGHNLRATGFYFLGRLQQALDDYRTSVAIMLKLGNELAAGISLQNMGALAYDLQDYAEAEARLHEAADLFTRAGSDAWLAAAQNELGLVYRDQGKWEAAAAAFARFVAHSRTKAATDDVAIGLLNLGEVQFFQGDLAAAAATFETALALMTTDPFRIDVLLNLGMIRQIEGDLAAAQQHFDAALALTLRLERRFMLPAVHYRLAHLLRAAGDPDRALAHLLAGIDVVEETRQPLREEGLRISLLGRWQQLYEETVLLLVAQGRVAAAFDYVERARSRALLDLLADAAAGSTGQDTPRTSRDIQAELGASSALVEYFATGLPGGMAPMLENLPRAAAFLTPFLLPPARVLAFVLTHSAIHVEFLDANLRQLALHHFHSSGGRLRGTQPLPGQPLRPLHRWQELARRLLLPLQPHLAGKTHLYYVPHGLLHLLPLHALTGVATLTGNSATTTSYGPSASILFARAEPVTGPHSRAVTALAVGVNGDNLRHAEAEAAWLAARLQGDALLGAQAQRAAVQAALPAYDVIHFSCHGHFRRRAALDSALRLADGELTAADLLALPRLRAELVTLSACDTGLNELHPGDELMGLTRAFLGNGARALLVTLWAVHEIPTRLLIERFYATWLAGASKAAALAEAQRYLITLDASALEQRLADYGLAPEMVAATSALFQQMRPGAHPFDHPYYWGAFVLTGDPS